MYIFSFNPKKGQICDPESFKKMSNSGSLLEFSLKKADNMDAETASLTSSSSLASPLNFNRLLRYTTTTLTAANKQITSAGDDKSLLDGSALEKLYLRLCVDCSGFLEKKYNLFKSRYVRSNFLNIYDVRRNRIYILF